MQVMNRRVRDDLLLTEAEWAAWRQWSGLPPASSSSSGKRRKKRKKKLPRGPPQSSVRFGWSRPHQASHEAPLERRCPLTPAECEYVCDVLGSCSAVRSIMIPSWASRLVENGFHRSEHADSLPFWLGGCYFADEVRHHTLVAGLQTSHRRSPQPVPRSPTCTSPTPD